MPYKRDLVLRGNVCMPGVTYLRAGTHSTFTLRVCILGKQDTTAPPACSSRPHNKDGYWFWEGKKWPAFW